MEVEGGVEAEEGEGCLRVRSRGLEVWLFGSGTAGAAVCRLGHSSGPLLE